MLAKTINFVTHKTLEWFNTREELFPLLFHRNLAGALAVELGYCG